MHSNSYPNRKSIPVGGGAVCHCYAEMSGTAGKTEPTPSERIVKPAPCLMVGSHSRRFSHLYAITL